jgi:autotransporter-associated beta strand protein
VQVAAKGGARSGLRAQRGTKILALDGGNALISGNIGESGNSAAMIALTKDGIGTWTLSGQNLYSSGTAVNGGTLLVNNTSGSGTGTGNVITLSNLLVHVGTR